MRWLAFPVLSILVCVPRNATACECVGQAPACSAVSRAAAVFVGRVVDIGPAVRFDVERTVAGPVSGEITVANGPGNCAFSFKPGERYVVYAYRDRTTGALSTGMCSRTAPLSSPGTRADLAYFDLLTTPLRQGGLLTGFVVDITPDLAAKTNSFRPLAGIAITVQPVPAGPALATRSRDDGTYELADVPFGTYRVVAQLPPYFEPREPTTLIMRADLRCAEATVVGRIDGRIRGVLLGEDGQAARGLRVHLADVDRSRETYPLFNTLDTVTDEAGLFEFRAVGPGRYVIGVGLQDGGRPGQLDQRRFYTQTRDPAKATVVELGAGERVELAPFRLAELPAERAITVIILAPTPEIARTTRLFMTGAMREPVSHAGEPLILRLPFGAGYTLAAEPPDGFQLQGARAVQIGRNDLDRTIAFRVVRQ